MKPLKILKNSNFIFFILFSSIIISVLFLILSPYKEVYAQIPDPYVTCKDVRPDFWPPSNWFENEFHSLRPYQASPCHVPIENKDFGTKAIMCGNDLMVQDDIEVRPHQAKFCDDPKGNEIKCHFKQDRDFYISLDSFNSEYPIAGNTELVSIDKPPSEIADKTVSKKMRLSDFSKHLPPDKNKFDNYQDYYEAYQRWRGKSCLSVPIPIIKKDIILCFDNPLKPNYWSKLFPNIPYSSTEDRIGKIEVHDIQEDSSITNVDIKNLETEWLSKDKNERNESTKDNEMVLYFPHMEEDVELTSLLQSTYLPPEIMKRKQPIGETKPVPTGEHCKIANIRYNPGDQLFGETIKAHIKYTAEFDCFFPINPITKLPIFSSTCNKTAAFFSTTDTHVPMADELWSKTVSGNASIVKRIFPKMEAGAPIEKPKDIPASSQIVHLAENRKSNASITSTNPEFYFPHMGGIYDYFLQDIQTALRPKGYGGNPIGLEKNKRIYEYNAVNEYLSWYLNGTLYRAENNPLDINPNMVEKLLGEKSDTDKIINYSGPLNKLLSQQSQWRNSFKFNSPSYDEKIAKQGRVDQVQKAKKTRHDQIVGCVLGIKVPILGKIIGGFPVACRFGFTESLPEGGEKQNISCDINEIASQYNIPACFLEGIWSAETGQCVPENDECGDPENPGNTCHLNSSYGAYQCCSTSGACGPMQVMGGLVPPLSAGQNLNPCKLKDSWVLVSRLLILKKCVAAGECESWEWSDSLKDKYSISSDEYIYAGYYYGAGCTPDDSTQCRWGEGKSYCDAIQYWCENKAPIPDNCTQEYCSKIGVQCP